MKSTRSDDDLRNEGKIQALEEEFDSLVNILNTNDKGFFLMVEGSQIDWAGHFNDSEYIVEETVDFDDMVGAVLDFAEKDGETLVVITADHECGGYAITGGNLQNGTVVGSFCTIGHSAVMVPVFAYGPGAEDFMGIYDNTGIFDKFMNIFGF